MSGLKVIRNASIAGDNQHQMTASVIDDAVSVRLRRNFAQNCVTFQVEYNDRPSSTAIADEPAAYFRRNGHPMSDCLARDIGNHFAGVSIDNHGVRNSRDIEPMSRWIYREIVPAARSADVHCRLNRPGRLSAGRKKSGAYKESQG